jgi:Histone methylation protein DOT1
LIRPVLAFLRDGLGYLIFERRSGTRTGGEVSMEELGLADYNRQYYKPSHWLALRRALPRRDLGSNDVFIDFGSGMGRVVLQAGRYPLKRVIGVELSEELNAIARANLKRDRERLACRDVELVTSDALEYEIPDDVTIAYFYNPFRGDIFSTVIDRLIATVDRNPRRLRIIYLNPTEHDVLMGTGRVKLVKKLRGFRPTKDWAREKSTYIYEVLPVRGPS